MGPSHRDVPGPPAHLCADQMRAGADERPADEERDEEEELGLAPGLDDAPVVDTADARKERPAQGTRTTLPMFRRSAMKRCASPARSNGNASATTGSSSPLVSPSMSGSVTRSRLPSLSHQDSMFRPNTPLFSFIMPRLFHHGSVAPGIRTTLFATARRSRFSPVCTSDAPYM